MSGARATVLAMGLAALMTFFLPIVHLSPPAVGQADWSAYDVTVFGLHGSRSDIVMWIVYGSGDYWDDYALLVVGLSLVWIPQWHKPVFAVAAINVMFMLVRANWYFGEIPFLAQPFHWPGTLDGGRFSHLFAWYGLLVIQGLMAYVTWVDYRYAANAKQTSW